MGSAQRAAPGESALGTWTVALRVGAEAGPRGTDEDVAAPARPRRGRKGLNPNIGPAVGRIHHHGAAPLHPDIEADVGHPSGACAEEHQITGLEYGALRHRGPGVELILSPPRQGDPRHFVGRLHQTRAIEADAW